MGLEAPLALLGLLAAVIPILIHRMRKRELPRLMLPTFALLARASAKSQQKRALSDLLLLLLRVAIIVLACVSLATPYLTAQVSLGDGQLGSAVFVLDDSLSMSRDDGDGPLFEQARARVLDALAALPEGSEAAVVLSGKPARVLVPLTRDLGAVRRALREPRPALRRSQLERAIQLGLSQLSAAHWPHRTLFLLSAFRRGAAPDLSSREAQGVKLVAQRVGRAPDSCNLYFEQLHAAADPSQASQTSISAAVRSLCPPGAKPLVEARVEVSVGGKTLAQRDLALDGGSGRALLQVPTPGPDADPGAQVRLIADDALAADNTAGVVLTRADAVRVLLVNGDPHPSSRDDELYFALRALALVPDQWLSLSLRSVDPLSFERAQLRETDVVVLANAPAPNSGLAKELVAFVEGGGGLVVTGGHRVDAQRYNALLGPALATHIVSSAKSDAVGFAQQLGSAFLPEGLAGLREVKTRERLLLEPGSELLLAYADGRPALVARSIGEGRSLIFAGTIDADWSDLPYRPGFLPLLAAILRDAAGAAAVARTALVAGDEVALPWPRQGKALEILRPDGESQRFTADPAQPMLRFRDTDAIGVFRVQAVGDIASARRGAFVVNTPADEADVAPGPVPELGAAAEADAPVRVHKPLAGPLLWALLLLALLEAVVRLRRSLRTAASA